MIKKLLLTFSFVALITTTLSVTAYATHTFAHIWNVAADKAENPGASKKPVKEEEKKPVTTIEDRSSNPADEESILKKQALILKEKKERERIKLEKELAKQAILEEAERNKAEREQALLDEKARIKAEKEIEKSKNQEVKKEPGEKAAKSTGKKLINTDKIQAGASKFREKIKNIFKKKDKN